MPNQQAEQTTPTPAHITPALLKTHSITADEYARIEAALGRTPSLTELGIFSVMWSEHCSYKSSRVHLKRLPTTGPRISGPGSVVQGPGENAGIIDIGDGWACAFKIESHNHPSYIEPYQGAATGVGGILRDIFTMNARPFAVMDSLRFGPLAPPQHRHPERSPSASPTDAVEGPREISSATAVEDLSATNDAPDPTGYARNRQTMAGVVAGVAGYGNCFGVPNLGGETRFEACYSGNPLVNAFALGLVRIDEIFYAKATGVGNPVLYVGAKTGRDGIHGATMASEEFTSGSEQKRPNVQMGDPFLEKLLLEACLEAMASGAVLGIQDMGAAGLTCSTCEMGARGELGVSIELDLVPQRETGMSSYEIMLSESQERMLLVAQKGREQEVTAIFTKWGLDCAEVGVVTADDVMRVRHHGELVAEIPNKALTDDAPVYHRPVGVWKAPVPLDPPAWVLEELMKPRDYTADLKRLLASPNICSKAWVYEQYDSMVQTNTVQGPGGEAGVIRIKGTGHPAMHTSPSLSTMMPGVVGFAPFSDPESDVIEAAKPQRGLAMALAGNGRWCYLDPKLGAMHAVAEAARKVACTGATPVAATNCLNFGNPEKPEIMAQLSAAIDGIAEACIALGTPVTGGNVSLYNETRGEGIYPTPVIGIVGILDDVTKAVPSSFNREGDAIVLLMGADSMAQKQADTVTRELGSSQWSHSMFEAMWGVPPTIDLRDENALHRVLRRGAAEGLLHSASDVSDGGLAVTLAKSSLGSGIGATLFLAVTNALCKQVGDLFGESSSAVVVTCDPSAVARIERITEEEVGSIFAQHIGATGGSRLTIPYNDGEVDAPLTELQISFASALESKLAEEVIHD
jgi:phosphoribosylformylglycinamidine (FGAM) synthase-like enzyme